MSISRGRTKVRLTVKLDMEWDADVVAWLVKIPRGQRSIAVRDAIRGKIRPERKADLETIRGMIAEELASALGRQPQHGIIEPAPVEDNAAEAKYGVKLDKMMGGLLKPQSGNDPS